VKWNSETGIVGGTIQKKLISEINFKGYKRHASKPKAVSKQLSAKGSFALNRNKGAEARKTFTTNHVTDEQI
jgi:hypothetical protein